jgi:hypothetical protein
MRDQIIAGKDRQPRISDSGAGEERDENQNGDVLAEVPVLLPEIFICRPVN